MSEGPVILYDGVCGLCNAFVRFTLKRDRAGVFRFAALQSDYARRALGERGLSPDALDTVYVLSDGKVLSKAKAALYVLGRLGLGWRLLSGLGVLPSFLLNPFYDAVARARYAVFGKHETCPLPEPRWKGRFLA